MDKTQSLTPDVIGVVQNKGTEKPYTGFYDQFDNAGTFLCRRCGLALFRSYSKFHSGCGWPSFEEAINDHVQSLPDKDGIRTEIICKRCQAHLGHVFFGEQFTAKNTRHCVNSLSLDYIADLNVMDTKEIIFAAGCFWGVEYLFQKLPGVLKTEVGYCGGRLANPSYEEVCSGRSGHLEAVRVVFDPTLISEQALTKYFFEIHDPTQANGQGPDIGDQYKSVIFYYDDEQKRAAEKILFELTQLGFSVVTNLKPASTFWPAEEYHQDYYKKTGKQPYCHFYTKKF